MKAIGIAGLVLVLAAGTACAQEAITAKKMQVKMHSDPAKKQFQLQSVDIGVDYVDAVAPDVDGASIHIYSATDDLCYLIPGGPEWSHKPLKSWKYKNSVTKNQIQFQDDKLQVKLRSGVDLSLSNPEGTYNVKVQLGDTGVSFCAKCMGPQIIRDDDQKYQGKDCLSFTCDAEPSVCNPSVTTTTVTTTTTTSTTLPALPGTELKAVLSQSNGFFMYNATPGVPGADAACNAAFAGTHACTAAELLIAEAAGDLDNIRDLDDDVVNHFWAIDAARPKGEQCTDDLVVGDGRWIYSTAHINSRGDQYPLNNATGDLGGLDIDNGCSTVSWVGCCQ